MKIFRAIAILFCIILLIWLGFMRERHLLVFNIHDYFHFINKYPRIAATDFKRELGGLFGLNLSPKLQSSLFYSLLFTAISTAVIQLGFRNVFYTKLTGVLYLSYILLCFILIMLGNAGFQYHLSFGLSHYLEDLFLSPFILMILAALFVFAEKLGWHIEK
ncbi:hypothetical protein BH11BAC2_BH11BAC2_17740 [soil metagenome]